MIERKRSVKDIFLIMILCVLTVIFLIPMFLVLMNSFKSRLFVSTILIILLIFFRFIKFVMKQKW